jgi:hypothetical protein
VVAVDTKILLTQTRMQQNFAISKRFIF